MACGKGQRIFSRIHHSSKHLDDLDDWICVLKKYFHMEFLIFLRGLAVHLMLVS